MKNKSGKSLLKYFGTLKNADIDWKAKEKRMKVFQDSFNEPIAETQKKMEQLKNQTLMNFLLIITFINLPLLN